MPEHLTPEPDETRLKVALLVAQWHRDITERLESAAVETLTKMGIADEDILVAPVPGAYELPQAAMWAARRDEFDAIIALGCVVRGETPHFDYVADNCARGLADIGLHTGIPVTMGVITADTLEQAEARSGDAAEGKGGNKGVEAADAAIKMAWLYRTFERRRRP